MTIERRPVSSHVAATPTTGPAGPVELAVASPMATPAAVAATVAPTVALPVAVGEGCLLLSEGALHTVMAALVVAIGSCIRGQLLLPLGLPVTLAGLAVAAQAMWHVQAGRRDERDGRSLVVAGLLLAAAVGVVAPRVGGPTYDALKRGYYLGACLAVWVWGYGDPRHRTRIVFGLAIAASLLHIATPAFVVDPYIDSWAWTQSCLRALTHGIHPYTVQAADIIHGAFYRVGSSAHYPYMPATLIAYVPAYLLFGDYRFLLGLCCPLTLWMIRQIGRQLRAPDAVVDATLLTVLLHPRAFTMVAFGWTEPLLVTTLVAFAWLSIRRPGRTAQAVAMLLLPALKQYALAPAVWFLSTRSRPTFRRVGAAMLMVGATIIPFLWWDAAATIDGVTSEMSASTTPSLRSTSLVTSLFAVTGLFPTRWLGAATQLVVGMHAHRQLRQAGLGGLLLGSGLSLLATFLTTWQAFVNYFYLVTICLALAALVLSARDDHGQLQTSVEY